MKFLKDNWMLLVAILVVAIIAGVITNMLVKQVEVNPETGEAIPGGTVTKGKLSFKGLKSTIK